MSEPIEVTGDADTEAAEPEQIYVHATFVGGDPELLRVRDIAITIPVRPTDSFRDYAVAIEVAVTEIAKLGYLPGYQAPDIQVTGAP